VFTFSYIAMFHAAVEILITALLMTLPRKLFFLKEFIVNIGVIRSSETSIANYQ